MSHPFVLGSVVPVGDTLALPFWPVRRAPRGFILGTHETSWLADARFADVPLMVSDRRLRRLKKLPRALGSWVLDSGAFTELQKYGRWAITARDYVARVRRYRDEVGGLAWAAPMDWPCEERVLHGGTHKGIRFAGTGRSVAEHMERTVDSLCELRALAPDVPWIPVLQGWLGGDYLDCAEMYDRVGIDLRVERLVGVGTMCRREKSFSAGWILRNLVHAGICRLHGFGFKTEGVRLHGDALYSADSLSWSDNARHHPPLLGHDRPGPGRRFGHQHCNNCAEFALRWRANLLDRSDDRYVRLAA